MPARAETSEEIESCDGAYTARKSDNAHFSYPIKSAVYSNVRGCKEAPLLVRMERSSSIAFLIGS